MTSARDLCSRLADLLRRERSALAEFLVALAGFDRERRWLELGHPSLFQFLHRELGLSKSAAFQRMTAAQLIRRYPEVVEPLRDGRLCLSTLAEVSKVITPENRGEVLPRFFHLSRREAMAVSAEISPCEAPPLRAVVTAVRAAAGTPARPASPPGHPYPLVLPAEPVASAASLRAPREESAVLLAEPAVPAVSPATRGQHSAVLPAEPAPFSDVSTPPPRRPRTETVPLTAELNRLHVTVSRRFLEKREAARAALSHSLPGATEEDILEAGLDLLLERHAKRRGLVSKPRREEKAAKPEHVPAHVKRAVWRRDGGRCQWPVEGGGICGSTHRVELDHIVPRARGGPSTVENVRLTCRIHNDLAARRVYGDAWMDQFTRGATGSLPGQAPSP